MSGHALVVVLLAFAIFLVILIERWFNRRRTRAADPECSIDKAWLHYLDKEEARSERDQSAVETYRENFSEQSVQKLRDSLESIEVKASQASSPRSFVRQKIMDATDHFLMLEFLSSLGGAEPDESYYRSVLRTGILRIYAGLNYGDCAQEDWYSHYLTVTEMNAKNVSGMIEKSNRGEDSSMETSLHEPLTKSMRAVRKALLTYPVRTAVRPEELTDVDVSVEGATEKQINELANLMKTRFERLFSGQLYRSVDLATANPSGLLIVEAALLYTQLYLRFPEDDSAWTKVLEKALVGNPAILLGW
jgi:hypothetical protein